MDGGRKSDLKPAALGQGTSVEVRDLFFATPARLKFLRSDRSEGEAIRDVVRRLAMSRPDVSFALAGEERAPATWSARLPGAAGWLARLADVLGPAKRSPCDATSVLRLRDVETTLRSDGEPSLASEPLSKSELRP